MARRNRVLAASACIIIALLCVAGRSAFVARPEQGAVAAPAVAPQATAEAVASDFAFVLLRTGIVAALPDGAVGIPLAMTPQEVFLLQRQQVAGRWQVRTPLGDVGGDCRSLTTDVAAVPSDTGPTVGQPGTGPTAVCAMEASDGAGLVPGLPAEVRLTGPTEQGAILVPVAAVWWEGAQPFVTVRSASGDSNVAVRLGPSDGAMVVLRSGPQAGEQVLLAPQRGYLG